MKLEEHLQRQGGISTGALIRSAGFPSGAIAAALRTQSILRIRRGWFGLPSTPFAHRVAVELGGRVGGLSAARSYGIWAVEDHRIHASWDPHGNITRSRLRDLDNLVRHWRILPEARPPLHPWRESVEQTIAQIVLSEEQPTALAAVDSALHLGLLAHSRLDAIFDRMPSRARGLRDGVDGRADSGLESIVRLWVLNLGYRPLVHPTIVGLEVDLLVGRSLVIEVDGREFHAGAVAFEVDRRRDSALSAIGCIVVRFSYSQVIHDGQSCRERLAAHLARGDHLRPLRAQVFRAQEMAIVVSPEFPPSPSPFVP